MEKPWIIRGALCACIAVFGVLTFLYLLPIDLTEHSPVQPLLFSHKLHAGTNSIACLYCHRSAPISRIAGIPSVAECRYCHLYIVPESVQIKKLITYWDRQEPIPWIRVNTLPDHVYFPHRMHIRAGIDCSLCHGDVAGMERISRTAHLKMGWCLNCHRQHKAGIDCWTCHI